MPDLADVDNVSQAPECASFGGPESGTMSLRSGNVLAMSDFAVDVEMQSSVSLDTPDFADIGNVLLTPEYHKRYIFVNKGKHNHTMYFTILGSFQLYDTARTLFLETVVNTY